MPQHQRLPEDERSHHSRACYGEGLAQLAHGELELNIQAGIVGFRGYSGAELLRLLEGHPKVRPYRMEHRADALAQPSPRGRSHVKSLPATADAARDAGLDVVFLATPHEVSMHLAPEFLGAGLRVIDLSGGFRLRFPQLHERWYGEPHQDPGLLESVVYGLPEFYREQLRGASFIANPGCYPTAANLALRPLLRAELLERGVPVICDAKSGVSGAGRKASLKTSFCEVGDNFSVYSAFGHRHVPEVLQHSGLDESEFHFVAQLLPTPRGILETMYARLRSGVDAAAVQRCYDDAYLDEPFVRVYDAGNLPDLHSVQHTNFCDLGFTVAPHSSTVLVVAAIDNLVKGAAGQAVQNMNLMFGLEETEGLL